MPDETVHRVTVLLTFALFTAACNLFGATLSRQRRLGLCKSDKKIGRAALRVANVEPYIFVWKLTDKLERLQFANSGLHAHPVQGY